MAQESEVCSLDEACKTIEDLDLSRQSYATASENNRLLTKLLKLTENEYRERHNERQILLLKRIHDDLRICMADIALDHYSYRIMTSFIIDGSSSRQIITELIQISRNLPSERRAIYNPAMTRLIINITVYGFDNFDFRNKPSISPFYEMHSNSRGPLTPEHQSAIDNIRL